MTDKMAIRYLSPVKSLMKKLDFDRHYIEALDFAIKNLKEISEKEDWILVNDKLPKIDAENGWKASDVVLVCLADGKIHMGFYCEDKKWRFCESGEAKEPFVFDVIAWQPLPKPYKEANNETN